MSKTIKKIEGGDECVGCGACVNICPVKCIEMRMNGEGFSYPYIDEERCINCGKCYKVCPTVKVQKLKKKPKILAMINKSFTIREKSSSGGVFYELAKNVIMSGGVVCAAAFDDEMMVRHIFINAVADIEKCMRSKYVQSNLEDSFQTVRKLLKEGRTVLFVGTPCQTYALAVWLEQEWENLYLIDLICHGVPSPGIWKEYVNSRKKAEANISDISFRDMSIQGWKNFGMKIVYSNAVVETDTQDKNIFMQGFLNGYFNRKCCYSCKFKGLNRKSDITLGDFWAVDKYLEHFNDNRGTSLVFVNTEKGKILIKRIQNQFFIRKVIQKAAEQINSAYYGSSLSMKNRNLFFRKYRKERKMDNIMELEMRKRR